jgi:hypothetical protein
VARRGTHEAQYRFAAQDNPVNNSNQKEGQHDLGSEEHTGASRQMPDLSERWQFHSAFSTGKGAGAAQSEAIAGFPLRNFAAMSLSLQVE